jgi:hypothetical protein
MRVALGLAVALVTLGDMITNGVLATWLRSCSRLSRSRAGAMAEGPQCRAGATGMVGRGGCRVIAPIPSMYLQKGREVVDQ